MFALAERDLDRFARAALRISNRTGAPLADLLDRLEAHQRRLWRVDAAAHAQTAGIRLTTLLLIALPPAALGLAEAVGVEALRVLLHTTLGLVCTVGALLLQLAGMAWAARIARPRPDRLQAEFAVAAELMAASLRAGSAVSTAVLATGDVLQGPLSACLGQIGRELAAGVAADQAWQRLYAIEPVQGVLARLLLGSHRFGAAQRVVNSARRSAESGAAMAGALARCADDVRADLAHDREAQVQRASVLLVLPLGLCFLPAFLLAGMVPALFAVLGEILG
jgi:Flp pilus assembly protein TadB